MTAQQPIMASLIANLAANAGVSALVAARIYDTMAPQDPTQPMLIVTIVSDPPQLYFDKVFDLSLDFQIDAYNHVEGGVNNTRAIGDAVYNALMAATMTATGYTGMSIICTNRGSNMDQELIVGGRTQQDSWRQTLQFKLYGTGS